MESPSSSPLFRIALLSARCAGCGNVASLRHPHWATNGGLRWCENRCRGKDLVGRDRPEHGAHPSWLFRLHAFQAGGTELTRATIADAGCIQQTIGAIALGSSLLGIERMMGGTEQISIRLEWESGSWKATRKRPLCPVRGTIHQDGCRLADWYRWCRLGFKSGSELGGPHGSRRKMLSDFQAEIPDPLKSEPRSRQLCCDAVSHVGDILRKQCQTDYHSSINDDAKCTMLLFWYQGSLRFLP
jgi:hypothetical protein